MYSYTDIRLYNNYLVCFANERDQIVLGGLLNVFGVYSIHCHPRYVCVRRVERARLNGHLVLQLIAHLGHHAFADHIAGHVEAGRAATSDRVNIGRVQLHAVHDREVIGEVRVVMDKTRLEKIAPALVNSMLARPLVHTGLVTICLVCVSVWNESHVHNRRNGLKCVPELAIDEF